MLFTLVAGKDVRYFLFALTCKFYLRLVNYYEVLVGLRDFTHISFENERFRGNIRKKLSNIKHFELNYS